MRYKGPWRGHLILRDFAVVWDKKKIGRYGSRVKPGAKSPSGMETNVVWVFFPLDADAEYVPTEYRSCTEMLEAVLPKEPDVDLAQP